jgi:predicted metalloprotease with PDZ domain
MDQIAIANSRALVEISVPGSVTRFTAPTSYGGAPVFLRYLSEIRAVDRAGSLLPLDIRGNEVHVKPGSCAAYALSYVYAVPQKIIGEISQSLPTLDDRRALFDHNLTFLHPEGISELRAHLVVSAPSGWVVATSWGSGGEFDVSNVSALIAGITAAGDYRFTSAEAGGTRVDFAIRGELDERVLKDQFLRLLDSQQNIVGVLPSRYILTVFESSHPALTMCVGTSLTNAIVVNIPSEAKLEPFNFNVIGTISHELFHQWNLRYLYPLSKDGAYLFTEGVTNYFAVAALVHANLITEAKFADFLGSYRLKLEANPKYLRSSFAQIQKGFAENDENLIALAYVKGPLIAVALDLAIRADTQGLGSLTLWFRELLKQFGGKKGYSPIDLRRSLVERTGDPNGQAVNIFDGAFLGGDGIDFNDLFKRLGIEQRGPREFALLAASGETATTRAKVFSAR